MSQQWFSVAKICSLIQRHLGNIVDGFCKIFITKNLQYLIKKCIEKSHRLRTEYLYIENFELPIIDGYWNVSNLHGCIHFPPKL